MSTLEREFYRNARGAKPTDQDAWHLIYDDKVRRLFVRHEWQAGGQAGNREYTVEDFLAGQGVAADALVDLLFKPSNRWRVHAS
jgi:hypothetical protein